MIHQRLFHTLLIAATAVALLTTIACTSDAVAQADGRPPQKTDKAKGGGPLTPLQRYVALSSRMAALNPDNKDDKDKLASLDRELMSLSDSAQMSLFIDSTTWDSAFSVFRVRYDVNRSDPAHWAGYQQVISAPSLIKAITAKQKTLPITADPTKVRYVGVVFHFGAQTGSFVAGVSVVAMRFNTAGDSLLYDATNEPFYEVDGRGELQTGTTLTSWVSDHWTDSYARYGRVRRSAAYPWRNIDAESDTRSEAFLASDLISLNIRNGLRLKGNYVLTCISGPDMTQVADTMHKVAIHLRNDAVEDLLDRARHPQPNPYYHRALNLGTPCPPRCKQFKLR